MKKHNMIGKILYFLGIWINAIGLALLWVEDIPEPYPSFSIPLLVLGVILLISTNFFKKGKDD